MTTPCESVKTFKSCLNLLLCIFQVQDLFPCPGHFIRDYSASERYSLGIDLQYIEPIVRSHTSSFLDWCKSEVHMMQLEYALKVALDTRQAHYNLFIIHA